jgi:calcium/proton exchanger cax
LFPNYFKRIEGLCSSVSRLVFGRQLTCSPGNAVELIIFILALVKNEIRVVQSALLGSILANLLLILGCAMLLGGLRFREQVYNSTVTQMSACLLSLSVISLVLPVCGTINTCELDTNINNRLLFMLLSRIMTLLTGSRSKSVAEPAWSFFWYMLFTSHSSSNHMHTCTNLPLSTSSMLS